MLFDEAKREECEQKLLKMKGEIEAISTQYSNCLEVEAGSYVIVLNRILCEINKALDILKNHPDDYGVCENCGREIDPARLAAYPEATSCVACKSKRRHVGPQPHPEW